MLNEKHEESIEFVYPFEACDKMVFGYWMNHYLNCSMNLELVVLFQHLCLTFLVLFLLNELNNLALITLLQTVQMKSCTYLSASHRLKSIIQFPLAYYSIWQNYSPHQLKKFSARKSFSFANHLKISPLRLA